MSSIRGTLKNNIFSPLRALSFVESTDENKMLKVIKLFKGHFWWPKVGQKVAKNTFFSIGLIKSESVYPFFAFSDLTCHNEDT